MEEFLPASFWSDDPPPMSDRESLEWAARFSPRAEAELRRLQFAEAEAAGERASLEWAARFSERAEAQPRSLRHAEAATEAEARRERESLEWAAQISIRAEEQLRALQQKEAEEREARRRAEAFYEAYPANVTEWNPEQPRVPAGSPQGGQWAKGGGGGPSKPNLVAGGQAAVPTPTTRQQLPANNRGTWVTGAKGNGTFRYNDSAENRAAGLAGKEVRFENDRIAGGGFPPETYHGGNSSTVTVEIPKVTGTNADNVAADAAMRAKLGDPKWERPPGYVWNHKGGPESRTVELVEAVPHRAIAHKGAAAEPRAIGRIARRGGGATSRAMGALTAYMVARDTLQAAGVLQPDFEEYGHMTYHFTDNDGSEFIAVPGGWFSGPKREFVDGPRKGQSEAITQDQLDAYQKQAEDEWGKYIPGTLFREPRFIPGKRRSSLPLMIDDHGVPVEAGWIDEKGVHHYPRPLQPWI